MTKIVTNLSSKSKTLVGNPVCRANGKKLPVENNIITIDEIGDVDLEIGYDYGGEDLIHFHQTIECGEESYYKYTVPIGLAGEGHIKKISSGMYRIRSMMAKSYLWIAIVVVIIIIVYGIVTRF